MFITSNQTEYFNFMLTKMFFLLAIIVGIFVLVGLFMAISYIFCWIMQKLEDRRPGGPRKRWM